MQIKGFINAIRTLTIIPVPGDEGEDLSSSLPWFPVVGLILGLILFFVGTIWIKIFVPDWPGGGAIILLSAGIILTGGLHLDGLADWADAMGGGHKREKRLLILKDSHLGAFGVLALIIVLLVKWVAFERLLSSGSIMWLLPVFIISRGMMVELMTTLTYARPGDGMARPFVNGASPNQRIWAHAISLCLCLCFGPAGLALFGAGWIVTGLSGILYQRWFGGITGDLLGTTNEMVEALLLMLCALPGGLILNYSGWSWLL